jgi:thiamine transport system substrate-binding protein
MNKTSALFGGLGLLVCLALPVVAAPKITVAGAPEAERPSFPILTTAAFRAAAEAWAPLFEAQCGCTLAATAVDNPLALLPALRGGAAEVVVGLPLSALEEARGTDRFAPHGQTAPPAVPAAWSDPLFLPVAYGWLGFVYDTTRLTAAPVSFPEIAKAGPNALRIAVDDPRVSSAGLDAVAWMRATHKDAAAAMWAGASPKLVIAKSRAEALAKLEAGEVDLALAATTWPALKAGEGKMRFRLTPFREGQFLQIESAAIVKGAKHPDIAAQFLAFLVTPEAQAAVAAGRGLYPVHPAAQVPDAFGKLALPSWSITLDAREWAAKKGEWLAEFERAVAK